MLEKTLPVLAGLPNWEQETIHDALIGLAGQLEVKNATLMWPLRISIAGKTVTPGGAMEILAVLGKEEALRLNPSMEDYFLAKVRDKKGSVVL